MDVVSNKLLTVDEASASVVSALDGADYMTDADRVELLNLLREFFDRWEHLHRVIPLGDQEVSVKASAELCEQAQAVRAFYG